jgi:predicted transposase YbfD/YdcC
VLSVLDPGIFSGTGGVGYRHRREDGTGERKGGHLVSAWAEELSLVLGQVQTDEKSNILRLLAVLDIADCMGCQAGLVTCSNRPIQGTQIKLFEVFKQGGIKGMSNDPGGNGQTALAAFGCIRSRRTIGTRTTTECRSFLTSLTNTASFVQPVRAHGGIENKLHWTLDVAFREDYARNRKDHSAANLAILRKITLNLIRLEPTEKFKRQKFSPQNLAQFIMRLPWPDTGCPFYKLSLSVRGKFS